MDLFLNRYRNLSVLLVVVFAQLLLLAYQIKSNQDVRLIRVWAVTAVTPLARVLEGLRSNTIGFVKDYIVVLNVREANKRLRSDLDKMKMENQFLKTELSTADRARALAAFQTRTQSRTIAARIIGAGTSANSRIVFVDRGTSSGVQRGMAVVTPDGIVGKVQNVYPTSSQVLLITDSSFAAGVISQKHRVHGTLKGQGLGQTTGIVDYVQNEEQVEPGEWFYTSGDDLIFPKGMPVGTVRVVRPGKVFKEIFLDPSGFQNGPEEVLIVLEGVHQAVPDGQNPAQGAYHLLAPPPAEQVPVTALTENPQKTLKTDADRLRERYKRIEETQGIQFGDAGRIPNFNALPPVRKPDPPPQGAAPDVPPASRLSPSPVPTPRQPETVSQPSVRPAPDTPIRPPAQKRESQPGNQR
jgi:rod shape-determining protein MreC